MTPSKMKSAAVLLLAFSFLAVRTGAEEGSPRLDAQGDPLPDEAVSRLGTTRLRDGGDVTGLAFTPDGKLLISDGTDGVRFWDAVTGKQLRHYPKQLERLSHQSFSLSPNGTQIAIPFDGGIRLLDLNSGEEVRSFGAEDALYYSLRFSPNGQKIAALCGFEKSPLTDDHVVLDKRLETWEVATGQKLSSRDIGRSRSYLLGWADDKTPIVPDPEGDKLHLWDADTGEFRRDFLVGDRTFGILTTLSPDGALLASICDDGEIRCLRVWNLATGKEMLHLGACKYTDLPIIDSSKYLETVAFACDGKTLVTGAEDGTLIVWDAVTGGEVRRFVRAISDTKALAVSADGKTIAGACGPVIRLFDLTTGKERQPPLGLQEFVTATAISADGRTVVTADRQRIVIWDAASGKELHCRDEAAYSVTNLKTSADGRSFVSLVWGTPTWDVRRLQTWDFASGKELHRVERSVKESYDLRLMLPSPDRKTVAVVWGINAKTLVILDLATGEETQRFDLEEGKSQIEGAAFAPDGRTLIVWSSGDGLVRISDVSSGRTLHQFVMTDHYNGKDFVGSTAAVSPDGQRLIFGSYNLLVLYDVATGREITRVDKLNDTPVNSRLIAFSPDGRLFAWKGGAPRTVYLTETATLHERCRFIAPQGEVTTLTFSPDGRTLITGNSDTTALVWDLTGRLREKTTWAKPLSIADLNACWSDLAGADAAQAYRAVQRLAGSPNAAVAYLKPRLQPIPALDEKRIAQMIADLDNDDFDVREAASKELEKWEEAPLGLYQKALAKAPSPEAKHRLEALIATQIQQRRYPSAQRLQILRALEVLERAGTPEARGVLETVARGAPGAILTDEARASLERSTKRKDHED